MIHVHPCSFFEVDFGTALEDMSKYFPLDVDYATGVGQFCDPVAYNSSYYSAVGLVIACIMVVLGVIFAFFGEYNHKRLHNACSFISGIFPSHSYISL